MSSNEVALILEWLYSTLSGDSTLSGYAPGGVWRAEAPPSTTPPYVIMTYQPGQSHDEIVFGGARAYSDLHFEVICAGPAKVTQTVANAAARIDTLISVATQTSITGGTILASFRTQPSESDVIIDGEMWTNIGGMYRVMVKAS
jgi:hypothetical protein